MTWDPLDPGPVAGPVPQTAIKMQPRMDISDAPGWVEIGQFFTLVDDPIYPKDPAVTRAIKAWDPDIIPAWCRWVWRSPKDDASSFRIVTFGRHAIFRYRWNPFEDHVKFNIEVPHSYVGPRPNILERILDYNGRSPQDENSDLPGPYEPWDWALVRRLRGDYSADAEVMQDRLDRKRWLKGFKIRHARAELAYIQADFQKWAQKHLDTLSDVEIANYLRGGHRIRKDPRLFVDMKAQ